MRIFSRLLALTLGLFVAVSCVGGGVTGSVSGGVNSSEGGQAKYIFYFIGDGMAAPQVQLASAALTDAKFQANYAKQTGASTLINDLNIKGLRVTGLATSNAANRYITDSAAAGTALATGSKTDVGIISQSKDGEILMTIAEKAKRAGMRVGVVSSVSIDHATPASFYAHVVSRNQYADISDQLLTSSFDYFGGGSVRIDKRAARDSVDKATAYKSYRKEAESKGYKYVTTKAEFDATRNGDSPVIATLDMLANEQYTGEGSAMPYTIDLMRQSSDDNRITLADFTAKGIELLYGEAKGFFMMVEGGKIDWACHANDAATCAYEVVAFDEAIGVALAFAEKHPKETLIVVTGDHDCGGLALGFAGTGYESAFDILGNSTTSFVHFTERAVAKMKGGESFESLLALACEEYGLTNEITNGSDGVITQKAELSDYEVGLLREGYRRSLNRINKVASDEDKLYYATYGGYDPFTITCTSIVNNKSGIEFSSYSHTALPVMVFAQGAHEQIFSGYYDNTDIAKKILQAAGL
ncbi:MAG: alkaline phosphatase [Rikenellaceae bacterium]